MVVPSRPARVLPALASVTLALALAVAACSGEEATPIDPANPPTTLPDLTDVTHRLEPTEEMYEAAEQQCLDDATLAEGYVRAVDPETEQIMSELTVDCDDVRAGS